MCVCVCVCVFILTDLEFKGFQLLQILMKNTFYMIMLLEAIENYLYEY